MRKTRKPYPILITLPHCSTFVPAELRRLMELSDFEIAQQSDLFTDQLFDVPKARQVRAKISRLVADPNRAPDDIESEARLGSEGVVVSVTECGKPIYKTPPTLHALMQRVEKYHHAFHAEIDALAPRMKFLIDGHSLWNIAPGAKPDAGKPRADITLGNRDYTTCDRPTTLKIARFFEARGLSVSINHPYRGKYVIGYHCSRRTLPGIQIEVNRQLYMNEKTLTPHPKRIATINGWMGDLVELLNKELPGR